MWIKTQGGYLLNLDKVEYVRYSEYDDKTYAYGNLPHSICDGNMVDDLAAIIKTDTKYVEVR